MDLSQRVIPRTTDDRRWLGGSIGVDDCEAVTLDGDLFAIDDEFVPAGTVLGQVAATSLYGPYDPNVSDGREVAAGILFTSIKVRSGHTSSGPLFYRGWVFRDRLPDGAGLDAAAEDDLHLIHFV